MKKRKIVGIFIAVVLLVLVSFSGVVGFQTVKSSVQNIDSPLFNIRLNNVIKRIDSKVSKIDHIGRGKHIAIHLPARRIITEKMLDAISVEKVRNAFDSIDKDILEKWEILHEIYVNNLPLLNQFIRENQILLKTELAKYNNMEKEELKAEFIENMGDISVDDLKGNIYNIGIENKKSTELITIGFGVFCDLTSRESIWCPITTGPIFCPTIDCNPITSRPFICLIAFSVIIFLAMLFPMYLLITVFNPDGCDTINEAIDEFIEWIKGLG